MNDIGGTYGTALIASCAQGKLGGVRLLLERNADLDIVCAGRGKALHVACRNGHKDVIRLLLQKGANVNEFCENTPLQLTAASGDLEVVKLLVAAGADINVPVEDQGCSSPLQIACSVPSRLEGDHEATPETTSGYVDIVRFLLRKGANPNHHGGRYGDPLQAAVVGTSVGNTENNSIDIVHLLLDSGASLGHRGGIHGSAMRASVFCGNIAAAHLLIERGAELDDDIFLMAVENERDTIIPLLLEKGKLDVNAQNRSGTALQLAIRRGYAATVNILLSHPEIDVNAVGKTDEGISALFLAVELGDLDLVTRLLVLGADTNHVPAKELTCLAEAVRKGDTKMATFLLDNGARVNEAAPRRNTALMSACDIESEPLVRLLLSRGADARAWVERQGDALQVAARKGNENLVRLLLSRGADPKAPEGRYGSCLECAISARNTSVVRLLLGEGANVNYSGTLETLDQQVSGFGGALSASIWHPQEGLTKLLIDHGAEMNWRGRDYPGPPIYEAISRDNREAFELLIERKTDVNVVGGDHGSALACALLKHRGSLSEDSFVQLLLDAGADVNIQGGKRWGCPLGVSKLQAVDAT